MLAKAIIQLHQNTTWHLAFLPLRLYPFTCCQRDWGAVGNSLAGGGICISFYPLSSSSRCWLHIALFCDT